MLNQLSNAAIRNINLTIVLVLHDGQILNQVKYKWTSRCISVVLCVYSSLLRTLRIMVDLFSACAYLGCGQTCINNMYGTKQCACYQDFRLNADNRTCSHIGKLFTWTKVTRCFSTVGEMTDKKLVIIIFILQNKQTIMKNSGSLVAFAILLGSKTCS